MLLPSPVRADDLDRAMRARLGQSLRYLAGVLPGLAAPLETTADRLDRGPASPFIFGLYAAAVRDLSAGRHEAAAAAITRMAAHAAFAPPDLLAWRGPDLAEADWAAAEALIDTDADRPFLPAPASPDQVAAFARERQAALDLLRAGTPEAAAELDRLVRHVMLGAPRGTAPSDGFGGASTFFLWGGTLINAALRRDPAEMLDVLIHEASHLLLFALAGGGGMTENDPTERYSSPLRADPRPIEGVFHAVFVATRVHLVLQALLGSGTADATARDQLLRRIDRNRQAALTGLDLLRAHVRPTPAAVPVMAAMSDYWAAAERPAA